MGVQIQFGCFGAVRFRAKDTYGHLYFKSGTYGYLGTVWIYFGAVGFRVNLQLLKISFYNKVIHRFCLIVD